MSNRIISLQLALFFKELMRDPAPYGQKISSCIEDFKDMSTIALQRGATIEFQNKNKTFRHAYSLLVASERLDFVTINLKYDDEVVKEKFLDISRKILKNVLADKELVRIGLISTLFKKDVSPISSMRNKFFSSTFNEDIVELSFRQNRKSYFESIPTNHVYSNESIIDTEILNEIQSGIVIRHDINTTLIESGIQSKIITDFFEYNSTSLFEG
ncbi:hypothetical protein [Desulfovibrio piger]|uniref:hypothetical protein n=1 Tax=Desulfovibrio piger TaxID=901 RepID=UPI002430D8E9|nr:hypothetical protein [Desulfovibrio piger]MCI6941715.1 hypothetical protein [Desulfovibrio piger]